MDIKANTVISGEVEAPNKIPENNYNKEPEMEYLTLESFLNECKTIALATQSQVKKEYKKWMEKGDPNKPPSRNKGPAIKWEEAPKGYIPFNDQNCGTAIPMTYIPSLDLHPVVIDLDNPKIGNKYHIELDKLKEVCTDLFDKTLCKKTGSGGIHIYLLSRKVPKMKQPRFNLDYQCNPDPETSRGKYVVYDWRWDVTGQYKEYYTKLEESPERIAIFDSSDDILDIILQELERRGYIKTEKSALLEEIAEVVKPTVIPGSRQNLALALAGYLKKQDYTEENVHEIFKIVFRGDEELNMRFTAITSTYAKENQIISGWSELTKHLNHYQQGKLQRLTKNNHDDVKHKIANKLLKHTEPATKLFFDYISMKLDLYVNPSTLRYYEKTPNGSIVEIDENRIIEFFIKEFGTKAISQSRAESVLKHIIQPLEKDYNVIEFANGVLNTETLEFSEDKTISEKIPKMTLPFNWNPKAEGGDINKIIDVVLIHPDHPKNKERWLRAVGHAFMGSNRIGKLTIVVGPSNTGKSTLTTILERLFNTSKVTINEINKNERFTLYDMVDKDINIDDDINNGILKGIGSLNSVVTGNSLSVEVKHGNRKINLINPEIPRLFANGNSLPPVIGEGFERRLLLIHAKNVLSDEQVNETLQNDILLGEYDSNLEWLVYTTINTYWNKQDQRITTAEENAEMKELYEFQSYPLKKGIDELFEEDHSENSYIEVKTVNRYLKSWCKAKYKAGEISKEHKRPSNSQIKNAMDHAGYDQTLKNVTEYYEDSFISKRTSKRVYVDIKVKGDNLKQLLDES